ncbi:hypothetical protein FGB62_1g544 [Gracilaria domingensis]|nr:hypothetical protein FGB62_1g544 [Gracilaria domingensis]
MPGDLSQSITLMSVEDRVCSGGQLRFTSDTRANTLAAYMQGDRNTAVLIVAFVREPLRCGRFEFDQRAAFTFVSTSRNVSVTWSTVFATVNTTLAQALASEQYTFIANQTHLFINDVCMYTRITQEEFEDQRGEKCFPSSARVITPFGTRRISSLRSADLVAGAVDFTPIIGWTHKDPRFQGWFLRLTVAENNTITVTHRHYIHTYHGLRTAEQLQIGMLLRTQNGWRPVTAVHTVWDRGLYNVQTRSGDVFVGGILCTTFTKAVHPITAHALLAPVRILAPLGIDLLSFML